MRANACSLHALRWAGGLFIPIRPVGMAIYATLAPWIGGCSVPPGSGRGVTAGRWGLGGHHRFAVFRHHRCSIPPGSSRGVAAH